MRLQELKGKRVSVIGAGLSGRATARALARQGNRVLVSDRGDLPPLIRAELQALGVDLELGGHTARTLQAEAMVVSPGVPPYRFPVSRALAARLPVTTELDLGFDRLRGPVLAVTGTNGKTTVATLLHRMVPGSVLAGNIGTPLLFLPPARLSHPVVAEVSSFQLYYARRFRPRVAVLLNLAPDHLDWHASVAEYYEAKLSLFRRMPPEALAVLNADSEPVRSAARSLACRVVYFSVRQPVEGGFLEGSDLVLRLPDRPEARLALPSHPAVRWYQENLVAAATAAYAFHGNLKPIADAVATFQGFPHRLEPVARKNGVWFINDSKATNPHATAFALQRVASIGPVALILGGLAKGLNLAELEPALPSNLVGIVAIGEASEIIRKIFGSRYRVHLASDLDDAVRTAYRWVKPRGVVLLSPACASFDQFAHYRERGERFKHAVHRFLSQEI